MSVRKRACGLWGLGDRDASFTASLTGILGYVIFSLNATMEPCQRDGSRRVVNYLRTIDETDSGVG